MKKLDGWAKLVNIITPVDANTAPLTGDWIDLADWDEITFIAQAGVGTGQNNNLTFTVRQATSNAGAGAKTVGCDWYGVVHASALTGAMTLQSSDGVLTVRRDRVGLGRAGVTSDMLDVANGFRFVTVATNDPGAAKLCAVTAMLTSPRYATSIPDQKDVFG